MSGSECLSWMFLSAIVCFSQMIVSASGSANVLKTIVSKTYRGPDNNHHREIDLGKMHWNLCIFTCVCICAAMFHECMCEYLFLFHEYILNIGLSVIWSLCSTLFPSQSSFCPPCLRAALIILQCVSLPVTSWAECPKLTPVEHQMWVKMSVAHYQMNCNKCMP